MSAVIKTRKAKRESSIASVMRKSFARFSIDDNLRSISIARTPDAFIRHGANWGRLVKDQMATIAKERGLTIASWSDYSEKSEHGLRVFFTTTLASFRSVFQGDIYADMLNHPKNKHAFEFINAVVVNGDENRGTVSISYKSLNAKSKVEIRNTLKDVLKEMDKRITGFQSDSQRDDENSDVMSFNFTYKDIPILSDADSYRVRQEAEKNK